MMNIKKIAAGLSALTILGATTLSAVASPLADKTIDGTGTIAWLNKEVIDFVLPTNAALDFSIDPTGLVKTANAGKVIFGAQPQVTNKSSVPLQFGIDIQMTGDATPYVATSEDTAIVASTLKTTKTDDSVVMYVKPLATSVNKGYIFSTAGVQLNYVLGAAEYEINENNDVYTYDLKDGTEKTLSYELGGYVSENGDWSDYVETVTASTPLNTNADLVEAILNGDTIADNGTPLVSNATLEAQLSLANADILTLLESGDTRLWAMDGSAKALQITNVATLQAVIADSDYVSFVSTNNTTYSTWAQLDGNAGGAGSDDVNVLSITIDDIIAKVQFALGVVPQNKYTLPGGTTPAVKEIGITAVFDVVKAAPTAVVDTLQTPPAAGAGVTLDIAAPTPPVLVYSATASITASRTFEINATADTVFSGTPTIFSAVTGSTAFTGTTATLNGSKITVTVPMANGATGTSPWSEVVVKCNGFTITVTRGSVTTGSVTAVVTKP